MQRGVGPQVVQEHRVRMELVAREQMAHQELVVQVLQVVEHRGLVAQVLQGQRGEMVVYS